MVPLLHGKFRLDTFAKWLGAISLIFARHTNRSLQDLTEISSVDAFRIIAPSRTPLLKVATISVYYWFTSNLRPALAARVVRASVGLAKPAMFTKTKAIARSLKIIFIIFYLILSLETAS